MKNFHNDEITDKKVKVSDIHFCLFVGACYEIECSIGKIDRLKTKLKMLLIAYPAHPTNLNAQNVKLNANMRI